MCRTVVHFDRPSTSSSHSHSLFRFRLTSAECAAAGLCGGRVSFFLSASSSFLCLSRLVTQQQQQQPRTAPGLRTRDAFLPVVSSLVTGFLPPISLNVGAIAHERKGFFDWKRFHDFPQPIFQLLQNAPTMIIFLEALIALTTPI